MSNRLIRVSRGGKLIGQYPPEQLASMMDTGAFLESDLCWSEASPEWTPLPEFLKKTKAPKYSRIENAEAPLPQSGQDRRRGRQTRQRMEIVLSGWIAFLLALAALAGAAFWISSLSEEAARMKLHVADLEKQLAHSEKEKQKLLFSARELAEPGTVKGLVVLRSTAGNRNAVPGIQILLYTRKSIEDYLAARADAAQNLHPGANGDPNEFFTTNMPQPMASTTTDASGRFEFSVPENGEYILHTILKTDAGDGPSTRIWFVSFNAADSLNTPIELNETSAVRQFVPSLMIVRGR